MGNVNWITLGVDLVPIHVVIRLCKRSVNFDFTHLME